MILLPTQTTCLCDSSTCLVCTPAVCHTEGTPRCFFPPPPFPPLWHQSSGHTAMPYYPARCATLDCDSSACNHVNIYNTFQSSPACLSLPRLSHAPLWSHSDAWPRSLSFPLHLSSGFCCASPSTGWLASTVTLQTHAAIPYGNHGTYSKCALTIIL